jgi:hypothetical protein
MNFFMKGHYSIQYVSPLHKSSLCRPHHIVCHRIKANRHHLGENFEANIKEAHRSILLDPIHVLNLRQQNNLSKVEFEEFELSFVQKVEQLKQINFNNIPKGLVKLFWKSIRSKGFIMFHLKDCFSYFLLSESSRQESILFIWYLRDISCLWLIERKICFL